MCAVKSQLRAMAAQCRFVQLAWSHTSILTTHLQPLSSPCAPLRPWDTPPTTSVATRDVYYPGLMYGMPPPAHGKRNNSRARPRVAAPKRSVRQPQVDFLLGGVANIARSDIHSRRITMVVSAQRVARGSRPQLSAPARVRAPWFALKGKKIVKHLRFAHAGN